MKPIRFLQALAVSLVLVTPSAFSQEKLDFSKKGEVYEQVIHLWNTHYREYFASELDRRLFQEGDVYVLYDVQIGGLQSFVEMARRCRDTARIAEVVELLSPVFKALKPISESDRSTGWICTGGTICTAYNFLGKEVQLCSVQFLGLLGAVATSLAETIPPTRRTPAQEAFLSNTFNTISVQLNRWFTSGFFRSIDRRLHMSAADRKNDGSGFFFSDKELWFLTALSDLSELHQSGIYPAAADGKSAFGELLDKKESIQKIADLFLARISLSTSSKGVVSADLDKGVWTYYFDNRYAGYTGDVKPVDWEKGSNGEWEMKVLVKWDSSYLAQDAGWDISHARRLVPALETLSRNQENIRALWEYNNPAFDPVVLRQAFANQIVEKIWNGDLKYPLFSNFWSGDNGWYRVAYAHHTGRRFSGYPPYGLALSILDGGYGVWGAFNPTLDTIFRNVLEWARTDDSETKSFVSRHYQGLFGKDPDGISIKSIRNIAFLADLVELHSGHTGD